MDIRPIRTDEDHAAAVREIEALWGAAPGTPEGDRLDVLATLVDAYEDSRWPVAEADPVKVVLTVMEDEGYTRADLANVLGSASRASEFLNRKRDLSVSQIRNLRRSWHIPADALIGA
jgi:HTH-type transcriptional regulator/antitoxin HigA